MAFLMLSRAWGTGSTRLSAKKQDCMMVLMRPPSPQARATAPASMA